MLSQRTVETFVGMLLMAAMMSLLVLAFKVSGLTSFFKSKGYNITAQFEDIGQLKVRAAIKIGGVTVGEVSAIKLDPESFKATVMMHINSSVNDIPSDSSASILTAGLLGDNYIAITPMYSTQFLQNGSRIEETHSAFVLEKLIGQLVYKISNPNGGSKTSENNTTSSKKLNEGV